jgi:exodeoxyribonuclease VII small subunit
MAKSPAKFDFDAALTRLEAIVREMDQGQLTMDKAMALFEEGHRLAQLCAERLDSAEQRVELLIRGTSGQASDSVKVDIGPDDDIDAAIDDALGRDAADDR